MQRPWSSPLRPKLAPCLTFSPLAFLKLQFMCHIGPTEIGGFGISAEKDLLYVEDFLTVKQRVTPVTVYFDDTAVADFFDRCVDRGLSPDRFARIWCHTHPAVSVTPSATDEATFARSFGRCDWAIMFILGRTGKTYCRMKFTAGPGTEVELPTAVDWSGWPPCLAAQNLGAVQEQWRQEYAANILPLPSPFDPLTELPTQSVDEVADPWEAFAWSPGLDVLTFAPVKENPSHDSDPRARASQA